MPLGSLCRSLSLMVGAQPFAAWFGADDPSAAETVRWVNEAQARVADEHDWQALLRDAYGDLSGPPGTSEWAMILPEDCQRIVPGTVWLRYSNQMAEGPLTAEDYEARRRRVASSVTPCFTLAGGKLLLRSAAGGGPLTTLVPNIVSGQQSLSPGLDGYGLSFRYVARVPDYAGDADVSTLGATMERLILLCAVAMYPRRQGPASRLGRLAIPVGAVAGESARHALGADDADAVRRRRGR